MNHTAVRRMSPLAVLAVASLVGVPAATAAPPTPVPSTLFYDLPAGLGCAFHLQVSGTDPKTHIQEFRDRNGNLIRSITAGDGYTLTYTNVDTGKSVTIQSSGSVQHTTLNPDGTSTVTLTGNNGLILFPTDHPAGPTTTQYVGRVVFTTDQSGNATVVSTSGRSTDLCAALAP